jgi:hypothetical protein
VLRASPASCWPSEFALSYIAAICFGCGMTFPGSRKSVAFPQVGTVSQGDVFARKVTGSRGKVTLSGAKVTLSGVKVTLLADFAPNPVRCVNTRPPKLSDSAVKPEWV